MLEWLQAAFHYDTEPGLAQLAVRLGGALVLGAVVAAIYRLTQGRSNAQALNLMATLVMLTVLIAMLTLVIGDSQARAFSLVGALAIIRFRTVVEDTRDTAFVIFAVAVGMGVGAGFILVPLVGIVITGLAAFLFQPRAETVPGLAAEHLLTVRVGTGHDAQSLLQASLEKHLERFTLKTTATARQGVAFELTYAVRLRSADGAFALVNELNGIERVQNVELRQA